MKKIWMPILLGLFSILILLVGIYFYIHDNNSDNQQMILPYYEKEAFQPPKNIVQKLPVISSEKIKVPILLYHYVEYVQDAKDTIRKSLDITPNTFEKQIQTLLDNSYTPIFIDELADILDGKMKMPTKPIILTFDDGYADFYTDVFPLLAKYKIKATIYVVPGFLDKLNYMTKKQVQEVAGSGLVEIASHTIHHINLKYTKAQLAQKEIFESKSQLEQLIGKSVNNFAYPYGGFNEDTIKLVEKDGYKTAASVVTGSYQSVSNRYFLYRLRPGVRTGKYLINWLDSLKQ
ncbi:polysaccharide deacetylase family protein [Candidatus Gottesmanbacteria bacterium]|nr:polysaccharide deacetylase family protein [Candidatus Gottesmanbacteria bacterium]